MKKLINFIICFGVILGVLKLIYSYEGDGYAPAPGILNALTVNSASVMTLKGNYVHIGDGGTISFVDGDGDLYVKDELEVDGTLSILGKATMFNVLAMRDNNEITLGNGNDFSFAYSVGENTARIVRGFDITVDANLLFSWNMNSAVMKSSTTVGLQGTTPLDIGEFYFNTNTNRIVVSTGTNINQFVNSMGGSSSGINAIVSDLTVNGTFYYNASSAEIAMQDNADGTTVVIGTSTFVQIEGTYISDDLIGFTVSGSSLTYTGLGGTNKKFKIDCNASLKTDTTNTITHLAVFKNGTKVSLSSSRKIAVAGDEGNQTIIDTVRLSVGDIIQIRVSGDKSAVITAEHITIIIHQLN